jgi:hypothetical protein
MTKLGCEKYVCRVTHILSTTEDALIIQTSSNLVLGSQSQTSDLRAMFFWGQIFCHFSNQKPEISWEFFSSVNLNKFANILNFFESTPPSRRFSIFPLLKLLLGSFV